MVNRTSVLTGGSNSFQSTAEDLNALATDFFIDGVVGVVANTSGVAPATGGLALNAQGTPGTTTAVTAGYCYVTATPTSQASQRLRVKVDASNITHSANSTGSTRYDWVYVAVDAALAANPTSSSSTTGTVVVSRSTSASTDNGTPPTYGKNIAIVTLSNGFTTVVNGNIADTRVQSGAAAVNLVYVRNPYKFSVYRAAALTPGVGAVITFDTKEFDTGSNVDVVTNKGRFTAPVTGFYHFNAEVRWNCTTATQNFGISLAKNGTSVKRGSSFVNMYAGASNNLSCNVSAMLSLTAGDYIEALAQADGTESIAVGLGAQDNFFQGFLVSTT